MPDVFISYSRQNLDFMQELADALTTQGKEVWFDQIKEPLQDLPPASQWWDEIKHRIETADSFIFIISPDSMVSPHCNAEVAHALRHERRIVLVLCHDEGSETSTLTAIVAAMNSIPKEIELPSTVSPDITNLRRLAWKNWEAITITSGEGSFEQSLELLVGGQDLARESLRLERERLIAELHTDIDHARRRNIGSLLRKIGDTRPGVGVVSTPLQPLTDPREVRFWGEEHEGLPDIVWLPVEGGQVIVERFEGPIGPFTVAPFYIAKYPVTFIQFQTFIDAEDGFQDPAWWQGLAADDDHKSNPGRQYARPSARFLKPFGSRPREVVSWYDAIAFCRWLNHRLGLPDIPLNLTADALKDYQGIRLPAEWEWQWAAQGRDGREYPWGPEWDGAKANTTECKLGHTTDVGMYPAGAAPCGALDMSGNVWEWCLNEYYTNPENVGLSEVVRRVVRGGSWMSVGRDARCTHRNGSHQDYRHHSVGFRVVMGRPPST